MTYAIEFRGVPTLPIAESNELLPVWRMTPLGTCLSNGNGPGHLGLLVTQ